MMNKIIAIPAKKRRGRPPSQDYDELAQDVSRMAPGAAVQRCVPSGSNPHIYRTSLRRAVAGRGVPCETALIEHERKVAIWPKTPVENFDSL